VKSVGRFFDGAQTEIGSVLLGSSSDTAPAKPILEQTAWRFYDDNAAMASSTPLALQNTQYSFDVVSLTDKRIQMRMQITNKDASVAVPAATTTYTLQRRTNGGPWEPVSNTLSDIQPDLSPYYATGDASTGRLSHPGSYWGGEGVEGAGSVTANFAIAGGGTSYGELVFCIKIVATGVIPGDVVEMRVVRDGSPGYMTFTQTASMLVLRSGVSATVSDNWGTWNATATLVVTRCPVAITAWQFYNDDANPDSNTEIAGANITAPIFDIGATAVMLRLQVTNLDPVRYQQSPFYWMWKLNNGSWTDLTGSGSVIYNSTTFITTQFNNSISRLPFPVGQRFTTGGRVFEYSAVPTSNNFRGYIEIGWYLLIQQTLSPGDVVSFKLVRPLSSGAGGGDEDITYPVGYPSLQVTSDPGPYWEVPQNVVATEISETKVSLTWDPVWAAGGYDIERNGVVIATNHPASPYIDTTVVFGGSYNYRVIAVG
jgi:hypothetical protein